MDASIGNQDVLNQETIIEKLKLEFFNRARFITKLTVFAQNLPIKTATTAPTRPSAKKPIKKYPEIACPIFKAKELYPFICGE
jgi:hypothetical protein